MAGRKVVPFEPRPFNPLERKHLGASVADALLATPAVPLMDLPRVKGAGIYAIYYTGQFAPYRLLADVNRDGKFQLPIYVGKAVPAGARQGGGSGEAEWELLGRLREHAASVRAVSATLEADQFFCRLLVVEDIWIPLGESLLIAKFAPVWNSVITGFGNHVLGKGRHEKSLTSLWDTLHPGRRGMGAIPQQVTAAQLAAQAEDYLRSINLPTSQLVEDNPALPEPPPVDLSSGGDAEP